MNKTLLLLVAIIAIIHIPGLNAASNNLIVNGDFESANSGWTTISSPWSIELENSNNVLKREGAGSGIHQDLSIRSNTVYNFSARIKVESGSTGIIVIDTNDQFDGPGEGQFVQYESRHDGQWYNYSGSFNSGDSNSVRIRCFGSNFSGAAFIDDLVLVSSDTHTNVVFVLVDDLGYSDLSCYGSEYYETPNIDTMAAEGMRFTNGYAASAVCSPTRAACVTGRYPARIGITDWIRAQFQGGTIPADKINRTGFNANGSYGMMTPRNPLWMEHEEITIAEVMKDHGYYTGFIGKWHLGADDWWPETQGFDENFAGCDLGQPPTYFDPYISSTNTDPLYNIPNLTPRQEGEFLTDREAYEASEFIKRNSHRPFFLYLCNYAVHTPIEAPQHLIDKYNAKEKTHQTNAAYAGLVETVDNCIGTIIQTLEEEGLTNNTLIVFTGDNGGLLGPTSNLPLRSGKGYPYEGGIREPFIVKWPGVVPAGIVSDEPVCSVDIMPTICDAVGAALPATDIDGVSLMPLLDQSGPIEDRPLIWHFPHYRGEVHPYSIILEDGWKLIKYYSGDVDYELYNVANDIGESNELSALYPGTVQSLDTKLMNELHLMKAKIPYSIDDGPGPDPLTGDLVRNSSFEDGGVYAEWWNFGKTGTAGATTTKAYSGNRSLEVSTASSGGISQIIGLQANTEYSISVWVDSSELTAGGITFDTNDEYDAPGEGQFSINKSNGGWTQYSGTFMSTDTNVKIRIFSNSSFVGKVYFDDVDISAINVDPYADWKQLNAITDDYADNDNDGISNLMEFALGGDPNSSISGQRPSLSKRTSDIEYNFFRGEESITYTIEKSTDLSNWTDHVTVSDTHGAVGGTASVIVSESEMSNGKLFLRLKVEN